MSSKMDHYSIRVHNLTFCVLYVDILLVITQTFQKQLEAVELNGV